MVMMMHALLNNYTVTQLNILRRIGEPPIGKNPLHIDTLIAWPD